MALRKKRIVILILSGLAAITVGVLIWFQPQKLFIDDKVDETLPDTARTPTSQPSGATATTPSPSAEPRTLATGTFRSLEHETSGKANIIQLPDGSRLLRFEDFETENGPDLRVYLSTAASDSSGSSFKNDFIDLGGLKGNIGNQNYEISPDVDLSKYKSAVIWCRRFSSGFGVAPVES